MDQTINDVFARQAKRYGIAWPSRKKPTANGIKPPGPSIMSGPVRPAWG